MKKNIRNGFAVLGLLLFSSATLAEVDRNKFADADALFANRGDSLISRDPTVVREAMATYKALLPSLSGDDLYYAGGQIGRLYIFEGDYLYRKDTQEQKKARKAVFDECIEFSEVLNPAKVGENQPYYYIKAACLAFASEVGSIFEKLESGKQFKKSEKDALLYRGMAMRLPSGEKVDVSYFGGGLLRTGAAVKSNPLARVVPGLYDIDEAKFLVMTAMNAPVNPLDAEENQHSGADFCDNHKFLMELYLRLNDKVEARSVFDNMMLRFDVEGDSASNFEVYNQPMGFEPETTVCVGRMFTIKADNGL